jgi:hypothetical protein
MIMAIWPMSQGNKTGDSEKVLNIQIDPKYNTGHMTTLRAGVGTEDRYQATGMWMGMREGEQISVLGNLNNTNAPLFDFSTVGGGARRGRAVAAVAAAACLADRTV